MTESVKRGLPLYETFLASEILAKHDIICEIDYIQKLEYWMCVEDSLQIQLQLYYDISPVIVTYVYDHEYICTHENYLTLNISQFIKAHYLYACMPCNIILYM